MIGQLVDRLEHIAAREPPPTVDQLVVRAINSSENFAFGPEGIAWLAPEVWAEAVRDEELAGVIRTKYVEIHAVFAQLISAEQQAGPTRTDIDADEPARLLVGVVMGYMLQRVVVGHIDPAEYAAGRRLLLPPT